MQEVTKRLQIGFVTGCRELDVKRDSREAANAQVVWVETASAPHAHLGFYRSAVVTGHGMHRQLMLQACARHAAGYQEVLEHSIVGNDAALELRGQDGLA